MYTLNEVLTAWEDAEITVEKKLEKLELHIFHGVWLKEKPEYYINNGKFFHRYVAWFIHRYFILIKDVSYILLDPLHIIDIIKSFVKWVFTHPILTLKQIWSVWTSAYRGWSYWLWAITADALLAAIIAWAATALKETEAWGILKNTAWAFGKKTTDTALGLPKKLIWTAKSVETAFGSYEEFFTIVRRSPAKILKDVGRSMESGISYWTVRKYKLYCWSLLKKRR